MEEHETQTRLDEIVLIELSARDARMEMMLSLQTLHIIEDE